MSNLIFLKAHRETMTPIRSVSVILGTLVVMMAPSSGFAQWGTLSSSPAAPSTISTENGYLFIGDQFVPPPYEVTLNETEIEINGNVLKAESFDLSSYKPRGFGMRRHPGMNDDRRMDWSNPQGPPTPLPAEESQDIETESASTQFAMRRLFHELNGLADGQIIAIRDGAKPMMVWPDQNGHELLEQLLGNSEHPSTDTEIPYAVTDVADRETWRQLTSSFQPTDAFIERASQYIEEYNLERTQVDAEIASLQWSGVLSYPITMLALVLVVVGLGHLMASAHAVFSATLNRQETSELSQNMIRLLVIMALMSAIDLVWTVMAHQVGSMRELNPLGSRLIEDTTKLIAFKIVLTGTSISLLFWLRRLPLTRKATWWCCLTLTLLTVRWLSFQSLLV